MENHLIFSEDAICFFEKYNGISFFEYSDCNFYNLQEAIALSKMRKEAFDIKRIYIGTYWGDYIYMDCSNMANTIYFSLEGIEKMQSTGLTFKEFLCESLDTYFLGIWKSWEYK